MRILYVAYKYDYGQRSRGFSFEHCNFFDSLNKMGHEILYFDLGELQVPANRERLNRKLIDIVQAEKPDLLFSAPFADEMDPKIVRQIGRLIPTVAWFCDDHWRFDTYTRDWAPCFTHSVTTAASAMPKYAKIGYKNVIKSQWAANHYLYRKSDLPLKYDVTFVGQPHGTRRAVINYLQNCGVNVQAFGNGWDNGRVSQDQMVELFNQSRINLNLSNSFISSAPVRTRGFARIRRGAVRRVKSLPGIRSIFSPTAAPLMKQSIDPSTPPVWDSTLDQIKGRNFEVPGCGGFTLTGAPENLGDYFDLQREIVCFSNAQQLLEKIQYYLSHETERAAIADAGHRRTLAEHTYVHRFTEIFNRIGVAHDSAALVLARGAHPGEVKDLLADL